MTASHNNATTSTVIQKVSLWQGLLYSIHEKLYLMMWSIFSVLWAFIWKDLTPVYCSSIYFACHLSILFRSLKQIFMSSESTNWYVTYFICYCDWQEVAPLASRGIFTLQMVRLSVFQQKQDMSSLFFSFECLLSLIWKKIFLPYFSTGNENNGIVLTRKQYTYLNTP